MSEVAIIHISINAKLASEPTLLLSIPLNSLNISAPSASG
jgi:hypothetical protein